MRRQLVFMGLMLVVFFLNSCAVAGIVGGGAVGCIGYEAASEERCKLRDLDKVIWDHHRENTDVK